MILTIAVSAVAIAPTSPKLTFIPESGAFSGTMIPNQPVAAAGYLRWPGNSALTLMVWVARVGY